MYEQNLRVNFYGTALSAIALVVNLSGERTVAITEGTAHLAGRTPITQHNATT